MSSPSSAVSPGPGLGSPAVGNAAVQEQLNRERATPLGAPERVAGPLSDADQIARSREEAAAATGVASAKRAALDAKLADMERQAAPHLQCPSPAFHVLRSELAGSLPAGVAPKSEIVDGIGFPQGEVGGVDSRVLRAPADPTRPQLVAYASENGQDALQEKLAGFRSERTKGEMKRAVSGLLSGGLSFDREVVPAMSILFDGSGLDAGIAEANEQMSGAHAKDLMAGVATSEALKKAKGKPARLNKAATGRGLGGRIAHRVFENSLPDARAQVRQQGEQSRAQVSEYVSDEARAQLLTQKATVEGDRSAGRGAAGVGAW